MVPLVFLLPVTSSFLSCLPEFEVFPVILIQCSRKPAAPQRWRAGTGLACCGGKPLLKCPVLYDRCWTAAFQEMMDDPLKNFFNTLSSGQVYGKHCGLLKLSRLQGSSTCGPMPELGAESRVLSHSANVCLAGTEQQWRMETAVVGWKGH